MRNLLKFKTQKAIKETIKNVKDEGGNYIEMICHQMLMTKKEL